MKNASLYSVALTLFLVFNLLFLPALKAQPGEPNFELLGWASENGGTTGGAGGVSVTATTGEAILQYIKDKRQGIITEPLTIYVDGVITNANTISETKIAIKDVDDVTLIGVADRGIFDGIGIKVTRASNIIIRNVTVFKVLSGDKDAISLEGPADHIWVDHCELYAEFQGVDKDYYDGLLDAKADIEYLTYSWNYLHDSWKTMLCGSSESDTYDRKLTMHHNYFENCSSRLPLFRGGNAHVFNNYYKDIASTAINSRIGACIKIENNYFQNVKNPYLSAYSDILGGGETIGNVLDNCTFSYSSDAHELPACTPMVPYTYDAALQDADSIPDLVQMYAGVNQLGDQTTSVARINAISRLQLYPTLVKDQVVVDFTTTLSSRVSISLSDISGRRLSQQQKIVATGSHQEIVDLSGFESGLYFLSIESQGFLKTFKLVKR